MSTTQHPLTETAAAELWDAHHTPAHPILRWSLAHESEREATLALLRAAFDAGQKYQDNLEDTTIRDIMQDVHRLRVERDAAIARAVEAERRATSYKGHFEEAHRNFVTALTGRSEMADRAERAEALLATPADPHHDPRPWQDCTRADIREGDLVEARVGDRLYVGVAHRKDENGSWWTERGSLLTYDGTCPLRRIPAPTPPAVEVEMPGEPRFLTDVQLREALVAGLALWTGREVVVTGFDGRAVVEPASDLTAFTLPDGTRARRDGERPDGEPRFVECAEGEK